MEEFPNEDLYEDDDEPTEGDSSDYVQMQSQEKKKPREGCVKSDKTVLTVQSIQRLLSILPYLLTKS